MLQPSPDRAVRMYVEEADDAAGCRICGQKFPTREDAAGHVKGLLAMNALGDHCRIHGFDHPSRPSPRVARLPAAFEEDDDPEDESGRRTWSLLDLLRFRL